MVYISLLYFCTVTGAITNAKISKDLLGDDGYFPADYEELTEMYKKEDITEFYSGISQHLGAQSPTEEEMMALMNTLGERKNIRPIRKYKFQLHQDLAGTINYSNGNESKFVSQIYGRFEGENMNYSSNSTDIDITDKDQNSTSKDTPIITNYTTVCFKLLQGKVNEIDYVTGALFFSRVDYLKKEGFLNWQGATKGVFFFKNKDGSYTMYGNYRAASKGNVKISNGIVLVSTESISTTNTTQFLSKTDTKYLGEVNLADNPCIYATLDASYSPSDATGAFTIKGHCGLNGISARGSVDGLVFNTGEAMVVQAQMQGYSLFDRSKYFGQDNLQTFFNTLYLGKGTYIP